MVSFFKAPKAKKTTKRKHGSPHAQRQGKLLLSEVAVDSLEHHGFGVAKESAVAATVAHPVIFVEGALPGEVCDVRITQQKRQVWFGTAERVTQPSSLRVPAFCPHAQVCGGCQLSHIDPQSVRPLRREAINQLLERIAGVTDYQWLPDLQAEPRGYRRKTRLAIDARDANDVRIGFRQQGTNQVVDIPSCEVLTQPLQVLLAAIREWLKCGNAVRKIGHISLFEGDEGCLICVRSTGKLDATALNSLHELGITHKAKIDVVHPNGQSDSMGAEQLHICYSPHQDISIRVGADDFVQINDSVNRQMVNQVLTWLDDLNVTTVMDLFCGTGNFSMPLAKQGYRVTGVEGVQNMVERARDTAAQYALNQCSFLHHDLLNPNSVNALLGTAVDAVILDPSREGALEVCRQLAPHNQPNLVYVSCNPASFARDAHALIGNGYQLKRLALVEMFAYTKHTELISLFQPAQMMK